MTPAVERIVDAALRESDSAQLAELERLLAEATRRFGARIVDRTLGRIVAAHDAAGSATSTPPGSLN